MPLSLVTGASRGIGRAIAERLGGDGFDLLLTYKTRRQEAERLAESLRECGRQASAVELDVAAGSQTEKAVGALLEEHGCPDVLINNAGIARDTLFPLMKRESWERVLATNLSSFYDVTRPVIRQMLRRRTGRVISIASTSGQRGNAGQVNYSAAKAGLIGATKALAIEVASRNVLVNAVAPGFIETDMMASVDVDAVIAHIPLGRPGRASEVAAVVAFLCSEDASYITGEVISVNGGLYT
jgi:3-oxoacyl-[acyl-carrier protein] reductase